MNGKDNLLLISHFQHSQLFYYQVMFPKMEWATIETVLRANNGAVDATIDQLLTLTEGLPDTDHTQIDSAPLGHPGGHPGGHLGPPTLMGHSPPPVSSLFHLFFSNFEISLTRKIGPI